MVNGRFNVPIGRFELYGGGGFGTIYFDGEADGAVVDISADGWLSAGDLFAGAALNLRNAMTVGVEWKFFFTDSNSDLDAGLDGNAVMLTLGFNR
jgi:opacity protein-like surface antigen